jgi:hypothetical protein
MEAASFNPQGVKTIRANQPNHENLRSRLAQQEWAP